jgi:hypothetical protein
VNKKCLKIIQKLKKINCPIMETNVVKQNLENEKIKEEKLLKELEEKMKKFESEFEKKVQFQKDKIKEKENKRKEIIEEYETMKKDHQEVLDHFKQVIHENNEKINQMERTLNFEKESIFEIKKSQYEIKTIPQIISSIYNLESYTIILLGGSFFFFLFQDVNVGKYSIMNTFLQNRYFSNPEKPNHFEYVLHDFFLYSLLLSLEFPTKTTLMLN